MTPTVITAATASARAPSILDSTFPGDGEMSRLCRDFDWAATSLGPVDGWPQSLRTLVGTLLSARNPMFLWWGPDLIQFYNDAYRPSFGSGDRHPKALGAQGRYFWHDIWPVIGPEVEQVMSKGAGTWHEDAFIPIERDGVLADVWWTYGYSPAFDDDGSIGGVLVICLETTGRVLAERARDQVVKALATERGRLAAIFDKAPSSLVVSTGNDHVYDRINPAYNAMIGGRDVIGKPLLEAFPELRGQGFDVLLDEVLATGTPYIGKQVPVSFAPRAGAAPETRYLDLVYQRFTESNGDQSLFAHGVDVTEQVLAVNALRDAEQRLQDQFANLPIATTLWERSGEDFILVAANKAVELIVPGLGARIGELRSAVFPQTEHVTALYDRCLRDDEVIKSAMELGFGGPSGVRHLEFSIGPQQPNRVLVHTVDVTEKTALESALRQAQRMESVGLLAGGIAHDFNNALTVIGAHNELLLEALKAGSPGGAHIDAIGEATARASNLTRQLLAFSRKQILQPTYVNANEVLENISGVLRAALAADIGIETRLAQDPGIICVDASQLEQAIMNLVFNAADAMPQGGTLAMCTTRLDVPAEQAQDVDPMAPGEYLCVEVRDTGVGMTEEVRARAFEPFFGTKEKATGQGMGLATVYGIVAQSEGHVTLESVPGVGTTARMFFPIVVPKELVPSPVVASPAMPSARDNHESILLVEDEPGVRLVANRVLTNAGYKVLEASSGAAGIKVADDVSIPLHMVLTDVVMPGMGGAEVVERVRASRPGIRAAVMSGHTDDEVLRRGISGGSVAFLRKPFTPAQLTTFVRDLLDAPVNGA